MENTTTDFINNFIILIETVANELGKGFSEFIYQEALCVLLRKYNINYSKEHILPKLFFDCVIGHMRADITLHDYNTVIECKAINDLQESHLPQIITYLEILNYNTGIFVNFVQNPSKPQLQIQKVTKISNELYLFEDHYNKTSIYMNNKGTKIIIDTSNKELEWITKNILYSENHNEDNILLKKDCKELYEKQFQNKNSNDFIKLIEDHCQDTFKDRQRNNIKYKNCIFGFNILSNT